MMSLVSLAGADQSDVFKCRFEAPSHDSVMILMKKYYDTEQGMYLGKVAILQDFIEVESTPTKVYQIPLRDKQSFMQIWYSVRLRVDAQISIYQGINEFRATYSKGSEKTKLLCVELKN